MGNFWAKSLGAGGQCEKWAGGGQEQEEEEEEEVSTWAATTCSPVAGGRAGTLPPGADSRIPKPRPLHHYIAPHSAAMQAPLKKAAES